VRVANFRLTPRTKLREQLACIFALALLAWLSPSRRLRARIAGSNPVLKCIHDADFIGDVFGGDVFSDIYGLSNFFHCSILFVLAKFLRKQIVLLPQTYGPFHSLPSRLLGRFLIRRAERMYARDKQSFETVRALLGTAESPGKMTFCPDVGFVLEPVAPGTLSIEPALQSSGRAPVVGLNISGLVYMGGYTQRNMFGLRCDYKQFVDEFIGRMLARPDVHVLLVPHTFESGRQSDVGVAKNVWESFGGPGKERLHLVTEQYDQNRVKYVIGRCDFFVASRAHACVNALSQAVPCAGVAYSHKFEGIFGSIGVGESVVDARLLGTEECIEKCFRLFDARESTAAKLRERLPRIRRQIYQCFEKELASVAG